MDWRKYVTHISVSQVKTHERNPRRWMLEKILKLPTASSPALELGSAVHTRWEELFLGAAPEPEGLYDRLWNMYMDLAGPEEQIAIEQRVELNNGDDLPPFLGYIDRIVRDADGVAVLQDHKTAGSSKYILDEDALTRDLQLMVYAEWWLRNNPDEHLVGLQHNQILYKLKRQPVRIVRTNVSREHVASQYMDILRRVRTGIIETLRWLEDGNHASHACRSRCKACQNAFGPNSCEYAPVCRGEIGWKDYEDIAGTLDSPCRTTLSEAIRDFKQGELTINPSIDIIRDVRVQTGGEKEVKLIQLTQLMLKGREQLAAANIDTRSVWDRREVLTDMIIEHIRQQDREACIVMVPCHFATGIDPDYKSVITQLQELDFKVVAEV